MEGSCRSGFRCLAVTHPHLTMDVCMNIAMVKKKRGRKKNGGSGFIPEDGGVCVGRVRRFGSAWVTILLVGTRFGGSTIRPVGAVSIASVMWAVSGRVLV